MTVFVASRTVQVRHHLMPYLVEMEPLGRQKVAGIDALATVGAVAHRM
jgi:hypothetical protein